MSSVFEGVLCRVGVADMERALEGDLRQAELHLVIAPLEGVTVAFRDAPRSEYQFADPLERLAQELAVGFGAALLVRYDDRLGYRFSRFFVEGKVQASYNEYDEIWVMLDAEGNPPNDGPTFGLNDLDPDWECETIANAIELGLQALGAGDYKALHQLMTQ